MAITKEMKQATIEEFRRDDTDTGSPEVQIALLTKRIQNISEHLRTNKGDLHTRRGLLMLVGQRRRHIRYLSRHHPEAYLAVAQKLGLRVRN